MLAATVHVGNDRLRIGKLLRRTRLAANNVDELLCIRSFLKEEAWSALRMDEMEDDEV